VPNEYNGGDYDWITLPKRTAISKDGQTLYLVVAYGGVLSEICKLSDNANMTESSAAYYVRAEDAEYSDGPHGDIDFLPKELTKKIYGAIENSCGTYCDKESEREWADSLDSTFSEINGLTEEDMLKLYS
jgi:hypothetical protein